jgi:hypothetical protein
LLHEVDLLNQRLSLLLRHSLLRAHASWREETADLDSWQNLPDPANPPPELELAGGFSVLGQNSAATS